MADGDSSGAHGGRAADEVAMLVKRHRRVKGAAGEQVARTVGADGAELRGAGQGWQSWLKQWKIGRRGRGEAVERRG